MTLPGLDILQAGIATGHMQRDSAQIICLLLLAG